jgi:diguanylate cyclase (GGDEF)-like protein
MGERVLGILMVAGAAVALLIVAVPPGTGGSQAAVAVCAGIALTVGVVFLRRASRGRTAPTWVLASGALFGTALITVASLLGPFEGAGTADTQILFLWVAVFSFYFFPLRVALLELAAIAIAYAWLLAELAPGDVAPTRLAVTIGTLLICGILVAQLRASLEDAVEAAEERARRDELTGTLNRGGLNERAAAEFSRALRTSEPIGFLLVDLDDFGMFNEVQGPAAGDDLLRHVAGSIERSTRGVDAVARLGADEFGVLLPGTDLEQVEEIANRLISDLAETWDGAVLTTISVGGCCGPAEGHTLADLWLAADRALEVARIGGGDLARVGRDPIKSIAG